MRPHKYIARAFTGKGYRYFYDADEYNAYKYGESHGHRDYPNRPHSRKPKIEVETDIFGREKPVTVKKGKQTGKFYGIDLTSDSFGINFKKPKPVGGSTPQFITESLKAESEKTRPERERKKREREKLHDILDEEVARKEKRHAESMASAKKKQEASKKRMEKLDKTTKKISDNVDTDTMRDIVSFVQGDPLPFFKRLRKKKQKKQKQATTKPNYYPNEKAAREAFEASQADMMKVLNEAKKQHSRRK